MALRLDYANCLSGRVGEHGLEAEALKRARGPLRELSQELNETRGTGWERWRTLPFDPARTEHVGAVKRQVESA